MHGQQNATTTSDHARYWQTSINICKQLVVSEGAASLSVYIWAVPHRLKWQSHEWSLPSGDPDCFSVFPLPAKARQSEGLSQRSVIQTMLMELCWQFSRYFLFSDKPSIFGLWGESPSPRKERERLDLKAVAVTSDEPSGKAKMFRCWSVSELMRTSTYVKWVM